MLNTTFKVSVWNGILWNKTIIKSNLCLRLSYLPKNLFLYSWFWLLFFKNNSKMYLHFILKMIIINVLFIYICCMKIFIYLLWIQIKKWNIDWPDLVHFLIPSNYLYCYNFVLMFKYNQPRHTSVVYKTSFSVMYIPITISNRVASIYKDKLLRNKKIRNMIISL